MSVDLHNVHTRAREFAIRAHSTQKYAGAPYSEHLDQVVKVLEQYGLGADFELLAAGYLHDVIEDTSFNYSDIKHEFGRRVAEIVYAVTDELGKNRHERMQRTLPKTRENSDAILVKLADRIANVRSSIRNHPEKRLMYEEEYAEFRGSLYIAGGVEMMEMWEELDRLLL